MVREQLAKRGITNPQVLQAFWEVPRHLFVPAELRAEAYADGPLPIGQGQTISQPYVVGLMTQCLGLSGVETVLEVGTGSGFQTAILARLAKQVYSLELHRDLAERAGKLLDEVGAYNVEIHLGDGSQGLPDQAPFDRILVTAAAPSVPGPLLAQLAPSGSLVLPVGDRQGQFLERWSRLGGTWHVDRITPVAFVPLLGQFGWKREE